MLTHLSLFTGIAGFELGMQLAGLDFKTVGYCEIDTYCQAVIKARIRDGHLDDAPIWPDIRAFPCDEYQGLVDILTGGFPCQDISVAGKGVGIHGERSGLWWEMWRCIGEIRPRYVILENVPAILFRGGTEVIGSLAQIGYDAEWHIVSAADVGAPHLRKRWWCLATDATGERCPCDKETLHSRHNPSAPRKESWKQVNTRDYPTWRSSVVIPNYIRANDDVSTGVDRLRALGNAVVPAVVAKFLTEVIR